MTTRRDYMREWRKTPNGMAARMAAQRRERARQAAFRKLAETHEAEFHRLFTAELIRVEEEFRKQSLI